MNVTGGVLRLLGLDLPVPDHTTVSRRSSGITGPRPQTVPHGPVHLIIDSTGLKLIGQGEWNAEKHGSARRSWQKLHVAADADTGEIVASVLTDNSADDAGQVPVLLAQHGRMSWQKAAGYGRRSLVETAIGRYKHLIGPALRARTSPTQQAEIAIGVAVLNRMLRVAKPISVRAA